MSSSELLKLENEVIRGVFWSAIERIGPQAIQFIVSIILARLLLPEQFGLIGMLSIFLTLGQVFLESGFGAALIQKQNATVLHYNSVFYANILLSILTMCLLYLSAPLIAQFYGEPLLTPITRVLSLNLVFSAFGLIQKFLMTKMLDFKTQMKASFIATSLSGVIGISMALLGFGVWSLVSQSVSAASFNTMFLWILNPWRPKKVFSMTALGELFGFGSRLLAIGVLDVIFRDLYLVFIGKLFSPADLGYYTRARTLQQLPSNTLGMIVGRVIFPFFSLIRDDHNLLKKGLRKVLRAVGLINFPIMIGLLVCSKSLVLVLLTEKWSPSIPFLQLLCMAGMVIPISLMNRTMILAKGFSDLIFRLEAIKKILIVTFLAITWRWGIEAIIWGQILVSIIDYYLNAYYCGKETGYSIKTQLHDLLPYLTTAGIMGGVVLMFYLLPFKYGVALLITQVLVGISVYIILCRSLRLPVFMDGWQLFQRTIVNLRSS